MRYWLLSTTMPLISLIISSLIWSTFLQAQSSCLGQSPSAPIATAPSFACGSLNGGAVCEVGTCCSEFGFCGREYMVLRHENYMTADWYTEYSLTRTNLVVWVLSDFDLWVSEIFGEKANGSDKLGTGNFYCNTGCQSQFGDCDSCPLRGPCIVPSITAPVASGGDICGSIAGGAVCDVGLCCSQFNFCGAGAGYCDTGCLKRFGDCDICPIRPPVVCATPSLTAPVVGQGQNCGGSDGAVCAQGLCCSSFGFCGTGSKWSDAALSINMIANFIHRVKENSISCLLPSFF
jgi:hypothetical protein